MKKSNNSVTRERIIEIARHKFFTEGFVKTSIDEIAREYHISKKTIYSHFKSKDELLNHVVKDFIAKTTDTIIEIMKSDKNSIQKLIDVLNLIQHNMRQMNLKYINDIKNHKPKLWNYFEKFRKENLEKIVYQTIENGKKENLFEEINPEIVFRVFYGAVRNILVPEFLMSTPISSDEAIKKTFDILLNGILTDQGRKIYKRQKRGNNQ
ncbi:MAG: TetR/AcrR family transcriptional regulator [Ignavibacteria bacterium]|nr:TetR/AcrR family transcriptional regulator [Ignavibacteria bacterium]